MKLTITHMKAPWPAGAQVGDVVELDVAEVPGWAVGKCTPAADDAPATVKSEPELIVNPAAPAADEAPAATGRKKAAPAA